MNKNNKLCLLLGLCVLLIATKIDAMGFSSKATGKVHAVQIRKTPIQIQQEAKLKNIAENLKKNEVFLYQEGTINGITVSKDVAMKSEVLKSMIEDFGNPEYEIAIPLNYPLDLIKLLFL